MERPGLSRSQVRSVVIAPHGMTLTRSAVAIEDPPDVEITLSAHRDTGHFTRQWAQSDAACAPAPAGRSLGYGPDDRDRGRRMQQVQNGVAQAAQAEADAYRDGEARPLGA